MPGIKRATRGRRARLGALLVRSGASPRSKRSPAADRRSRLPGAAAGGRHHRRPTAAHDSRARCPAWWSRVNDALDADPALLLTDPCGQGWIACISPTRLEEEAAELPAAPRHPAEPRTASRPSARRRSCSGWAATFARSPIPRELEAVRKDFDATCCLFDAAAFGTEGPGIVGEINANDPIAEDCRAGFDRLHHRAGVSHPPHLLLCRRAVRRQRNRRHPGRRPSSRRRARRCCRTARSPSR